MSDLRIGEICIVRLSLNVTKASLAFAFGKRKERFWSNWHFKFLHETLRNGPLMRKP